MKSQSRKKNKQFRFWTKFINWMTSENKVSEKLSTEELKQRQQANELDGFPTDAKTESGDR